MLQGTKRGEGILQPFAYKICCLQNLAGYLLYVVCLAVHHPVGLQKSATMAAWHRCTGCLGKRCNSIKTPHTVSGLLSI